MTLANCVLCGTEVTAGDNCPTCGTPTPAPASAPAARPAGPGEPGRAGPGPATRYANQWEAILEKLRRAAAPKYAVRRILGYGGMAGVYLADEPRLGRQVAIKVMSPGLMVDPKLVDRFSQEARTIAQLSHPNIVTIYEVDERDDLHWFTMTFVPGRTLGQVMYETTEPMPVDVVRAWLYQIGDALSYAHHHGVVHRDVKPGNVLLDLRGNALVTDFGIAKVADAEAGLTRTGMLVGTPAYMSPEQCSSGKVAGASDQYSVGAVAYQMLTGQPPFAGPTLSVLQAHVGQQPTPIRDLRPGCPADLTEAVERMLSKRPDDRFPSMSAAITAAGCAPPGLDGPIREQLGMLASHAAGIDVSPWFDFVREGTREQLRVSIVDGAGRALPPRRIEWRSGDALVASVSADGTLQALCPGVTRIDAVCGGATTSLAITVEADPVRDLEIEPARASVPTGGRITLTAVVRDWDGGLLDDRAVLWSSSDSAIAAVSFDGNVEGVAAGDATINASTGGKSAAAGVTVTREVIATPPGQTGGSGATLRPATRPPRSEATTPARPMTTPPRPVKPVPASPKTAADPMRRYLMVAIVAAIVVVGGLFAWRPWAREQPLVDPDSPQQAAQAPDPVPAEPQPVVPESTVVVAGPDATAPAGSTRVDPPQQPTGQRATPPATQQTQQQTQQQAVPAQPLDGTVEVGGSLPAGATLSARDAAGNVRTINGRSIQLPPGTWTFDLRAPGHENDTQALVVRPGETRTWTPVVRALPPAQPPPQPAQPTRDTRADEAAVQTAVRDFIAAFNRRDAAAVVPLLPANARNAWRTLLENRSVTDFRATAGGIDTPRVDGDAATVGFTVNVSFRSQNADQNQTIRYEGSAQRAGAGWRLTALRQAGG